MTPSAPPAAEQSQQPPFSGVVVARNEAAKLGECLKSIAFCDQIALIDLQSEDGSAELARSLGAQVHRYAPVPVVEQIRATAFSHAAHDWVVHLDPDERFPAQRLQEIRAAIAVHPDLALIKLPWRFHFRGRPLQGTVWGWNNSKPVLYHRGRIELPAGVHGNARVLPGFTELTLAPAASGALEHLWIDSYRQLFSKHLRYLRQEGASRYAAGERFSWKGCCIATLKAFRLSFFQCRGWSGGPVEAFLSCFYAWYVLMSLLSLRDYQKNAGRTAA